MTDSHSSTSPGFFGWSSARIVYVRNLATSWLGYTAALVVAFFLSPFIIHSLGDSAYGFWTLLMSMTGYLGLIDLGVRVSTGRYLNYYLGLNDIEGANRIINASLVMYTIASALILLIALVLGAEFHHIFKGVPETLAGQATWLLPLLAVSIWMSLYASVFGQLLLARDRFDIKNFSDVLILGIRSTATVIVIKAGTGLFGLAVVLVACSVVESVTLYCAVRLLKLPFRFDLWGVTRSAFRELLGYSSWSFLINAGSRIISYADAAVIAIVLGVASITIYSVGFMLVDYGTNLMAHAAGVMTPEIYKQAGRRELRALRSLVIEAARNTMFFSVPLLVGFMVFGKQFIYLWMGPKYDASATVLLILSVPQLGLLANRGCGAVLWGLGHLRFLSMMTLAEAIVNLVLSVFLAKVMGLGIYGIALGTAIPMIITGWILIPVYACRQIQLGLIDYFRLTVARWLPAAALFFGVCLGVRRLMDGSSWSHFAVQVAVTSIIYLPIGWFFMLRSRLPSSVSLPATADGRVG